MARKISEAVAIKTDSMPRISFTVKDLPEIKDWKIGGKYKLDIEVEEVAISKDEWGDNEPMRATFKVKKVNVCDE